MPLRCYNTQVNELARKSSVTAACIELPMMVGDSDITQAPFDSHTSSPHSTHVCTNGMMRMIIVVIMIVFVIRTYCSDDASFSLQEEIWLSPDLIAMGGFCGRGRVSESGNHDCFNTELSEWRHQLRTYYEACRERPSAPAKSPQHTSRH